jgi:hypothetical protein
MNLFPWEVATSNEAFPDQVANDAQALSRFRQEAKA